LLPKEQNADDAPRPIIYMSIDDNYYTKATPYVSRIEEEIGCVRKIQLQKNLKKRKRSTLRKGF